MKRKIDLHVHSTSSDGSYTPSQLVKLAEEKKLAAFALTDHDTVSGIEEAVEAARESSVEVVPGIEFSTRYENRDIHILGLDIDYQDVRFQENLENFRASGKYGIRK